MRRKTGLLLAAILALLCAITYALFILMEDGGLNPRAVVFVGYMAVITSLLLWAWLEIDVRKRFALECISLTGLCATAILALASFGLFLAVPAILAVRAAKLDFRRTSSAHMSVIVVGCLAMIALLVIGILVTG